jgi:hypothetical protein
MWCFKDYICQGLIKGNDVSGSGENGIRLRGKYCQTRLEKNMFIGLNQECGILCE